MQTRTVVLLVAAVVSGVMLFGASGVSANPLGVPVAEPGPFSCTIDKTYQILNKTITQHFEVTAIRGPSDEFPYPVEGCTGSHSGSELQCARYGYTITSSVDLDDVVFAISADQDLDRTTSSPSTTVFVSTPGAGDPHTNFLTKAFHEYTVRFDSEFGSHVRSLEADIYILTPTAPRISTVLLNGFFPLLRPAASCLIAGPGVSVTQFKPLTASQNVTCAGGKCTCKLTYDTAGNLQSVTTEEPCTASSVSVCVTLTGEATQSTTCEPVQNFETITSGTGTCTTYPTRPVATTVCKQP
jgi:hypothetical protein